jgi:transposase
MAEPIVYIGVDVAKDKLDISVPGEDGRVIANTTRAVRGWLAGIKRSVRLPFVCCEASGGYERLLRDACWDTGVPVCVMNAGQVRHYARHIGLLEKTDRIDARVISAAARDKAGQGRLTPLAKQTGRQSRLSEYGRARAKLVETREGLQKSASGMAFKEASGVFAKAVKALDRQIARLDALLDKEIKQDAGTSGLVDRLQTVKGIGKVTATALVCLLPEMFTLDDRPLAKLAGVAPVCNDSGTLSAPRHMAGGRPRVRKALYMAALAASRSNAILKALYTRLLERKKPKKVALGAVMRKLLCLARRIAQDPGFKPLPA